MRFFVGWAERSESHRWKRFDTARRSPGDATPGLETCRRVVPAYLLAVMLLAVASLPAADPPASDLAPTIDFVQKRCVKLYGAGAGREHGYATGLIVSPDGQILTALGIYLTEDRLRAILPDGSRQEAQVVRRGESLQIALLKVDAKTPNYFELSADNRAEQGDWVLAVSNVFNVAAPGEPLSVTMGIVSVRAEMAARHRAQEIPYEGDMLLVDAVTSNPGSPGGALCTLDGRLTGMLGKLFVSKNTATRINYAVPVDLLTRFLDEGRPEPPPVAKVVKTMPGAGPAWLGVRLFRVSGDRSPAYVDLVAPDSPAKEAGLRKDDLILAVGTTEIRTCQQFDEVSKQLMIGKPVEVIVKRGKTIKVFSVTPGEKTEKGK